MDPAELEKRTQELLMHFDALDVEGMRGMVTQDVQGVDEISKTWLRGADQLDNYFRMAGSVLSDIHSEISDVHVVMHGEVGIVTCMVDQSYKFEGQPTAIKVPFTAVYAKENGDWKVCLIHAVGLPSE